MISVSDNRWFEDHLFTNCISLNGETRDTYTYSRSVFNHKTSIEKPFFYEQSGLSPQGAVVLVSERRVVFWTRELFFLFFFRILERLIGRLVTQHTICIVPVLSRYRDLHKSKGRSLLVRRMERYFACN